MFQNSPTCSKVIWGNEQKKICAMQLPRAQALLWKEISAKFPNSVNNYNQFEGNQQSTNKVNLKSSLHSHLRSFPDNTSPDEVKRPLSQISLCARFCHLPRNESLLKGNYICLTFFTSKHWKQLLLFALFKTSSNLIFFRIPEGLRK